MVKHGQLVTTLPHVASKSPLARPYLKHHALQPANATNQAHDKNTHTQASQTYDVKLNATTIPSAVTVFLVPIDTSCSSSHAVTACVDVATWLVLVVAVCATSYAPVNAYVVLCV